MEDFASPPSSESASVAVSPRKPTRRGRPEYEERAAADPGEWPKQPPFTIYRRVTRQYAMVGHLSPAEYREALNGAPTFPWADYLACDFGTGHYMVISQAPGGKRAKSFFQVTPEMREISMARRGQTDDDDQADDDTTDNPPSSIDAILSNAEAIERLKAALGVKPNPPAPPPPPGILDFLANPAIAPIIPKLLDALKTQPATPATRPPEAQAWEEIGRIYAELGITPEAFRANLERELAAAQEAQQQSARP